MWNKQLPRLNTRLVPIKSLVRERVLGRAYPLDHSQLEVWEGWTGSTGKYVPINCTSNWQVRKCFVQMRGFKGRSYGIRLLPCVTDVEMTSQGGLWAAIMRSLQTTRDPWWQQEITEAKKDPWNQEIIGHHELNNNPWNQQTILEAHSRLLRSAVILGINKRFLEFINISVITKITEVLPGQRTGVKSATLPLSLYPPQNPVPPPQLG